MDLRGTGIGFYTNYWVITQLNIALSNAARANPEEFATPETVII